MSWCFQPCTIKYYRHVWESRILVHVERAVDSAPRWNAVCLFYCLLSTFFGGKTLFNAKLQLFTTEINFCKSYVRVGKRRRVYTVNRRILCKIYVMRCHFFHCQRDAYVCHWLYWFGFYPDKGRAVGGPRIRCVHKRSPPPVELVFRLLHVFFVQQQ